MDNRRAHPRYPVSLSCEIFTGTDVVYAVAKNLSLGGLGVACKSALPEKAQVGISMFLVEDGIEDAKTEPLNLKGEVVWCTPSDTGGHMAGLRFPAITAAQQQAINHFLMRLTGG
jgi:c-di-GMP-binding flagellar brake protein YcgR